MRASKAIAPVLVATIVLLAGTAFLAQAQDSTGTTYHACLYAGSITQATMSNSPPNCGRGVLISWNQQGPPGPQGIAGASGAPGPQGQNGATGATGPAGAPGAPGEPEEPGPKGLNWRGDWSLDDNYSTDDAVHHAGHAWISLVDDNDDEPGVDDGATSWSLLAERGDDGVDGQPGADGSPGPPGQNGVDGSPGAPGQDGSPGAPGDQGPPGPPGSQGPPGQPGTAGAPGAAGSNGAVGPAGSPGPAGSDGAPGPVGPIGMEWRGTWSDSETYDTRDAVSHEGNSYIAVVDGLSGPGDAPGTNDGWHLLAARGLDGTDGSDGVDGEPGPQGPAGMTWRGNWSNDAANPLYPYGANDAVHHLGRAWISLIDANTSIPGDNPSHWGLLAAQGAQGEQGIQGPAGPPGEDGGSGGGGSAPVTTIRTATTSLTPDNSVLGQGKTLSKTCNTGEVVVGGGWSVPFGYFNHGVHSYPSLANTWTVTVRWWDPNGGASSTTLTVYAICQTTGT